jgi:malonyl CoA-acyl carrier protein transacylase
MKTQHRTAPGHSIGELCVGADWAVANGDLETLGNLVGRLSELIRDRVTLRAGLLEVERLCRSNSDRAIARWLHLKPLLQGEQRS